MEILQTIWNALTNENELLLNIISVPMTFIEVSIAFLIFTSVLNISYTKKQAIPYIISFSFVAIVTIYFIPTPYNTFLNLFRKFILIKFFDCYLF